MKAQERQNRLQFKTIALLGFALLAFCGSRLEAQVVVNIPDANLEAVIREALGIPTDPLTDTDLASLTSLIAYEREITNLTGLEYCVNLTGLWLYGNNIGDISALAGFLVIFCHHLQFWLLEVIGNKFFYFSNTK